MNKSSIKILLLSSIALLAAACTSAKKGTEIDTKDTALTEEKSALKTECPNSKTGKLLDMTDLDGCGWMIKLSDGTELDPTNLDSFNIEMVNGKKVSVSYIEKPQMAGICMAGAIVEIKCIVELKSE